MGLFIIPRQKKKKKGSGVLCYNRRTIWVSVRPSVRVSFPDSNLSSFWPIFSRFCMDIDIGEKWFGIANGLNSFINDMVMALIDVKMCFSSISSEDIDEF